MRLRSATAVIALAAALLGPAQAVFARPAEREHDERVLQQLLPPAGTEIRRPGPPFTPDAAAREIQRMHGGRVLGVRPDGDGYRVKMLKDGEVRIYQVDP